MNKFVRAIQNYLFFSFPFVISLMIWGSIQTQREDNPQVAKILWEIMAWNLMTWFVIFIGFLVSMLFVPSIRMNSLKRLANLQDRDERELKITGYAATASYISSLSLLIFLLFFSMFTFHVSRTPEVEAKDGKTKDLSINLTFDLFDEGRVESSLAGDIIAESKQIPLSKTALLLIILVWQIGSFTLYARSELKGDQSLELTSPQN